MYGPVLPFALPVVNLLMSISWATTIGSSVDAGDFLLALVLPVFTGVGIFTGIFSLVIFIGSSISISVLSYLLLLLLLLLLRFWVVLSDFLKLEITSSSDCELLDLSWVSRDVTLLLVSVVLSSIIVGVKLFNTANDGVATPLIGGL